jgi:hypothetical protein
MRRVAVLMALSVGLVAVFALPAAAFGASSPTTTVNPLSAGSSSSPFSPGIPQAQTTTPTTTTAPVVTSTTSSDSGALSSSDAIVIGIGAIVILAAISLFIWRDARRRAPVRHRTAAATADAGGRAGSKARGKPRKLSPAEKRRRKRGKAR